MSGDVNSASGCKISSTKDSDDKYEIFFNNAQWHINYKCDNGEPSYCVTKLSGAVLVTSGPPATIGSDEELSEQECWSLATSSNVGEASQSEFSVSSSISAASYPNGCFVLKDGSRWRFNNQGTADCSNANQCVKELVASVTYGPLKLRVSGKSFEITGKADASRPACLVTASTPATFRLRTSPIRCNIADTRRG